MALELLRKGEFGVQDTELKGVVDPDPEVSYQLRVITREVNREIANRHKPTIVGREADLDAMLDDLIDYALVSWSGFVADGVQAPCTRENKLQLDAARKNALVVRAGSNRRAPEVRAASFSEPANVG